VFKAIFVLDLVRIRLLVVSRGHNSSSSFSGDTHNPGFRYRM
jgi:hypothetical protein